jgi:hypothetical protein
VICPPRKKSKTNFHFSKHETKKTKKKVHKSLVEFLIKFLICIYRAGNEIWQRARFGSKEVFYGPVQRMKTRKFDKFSFIFSLKAIKIHCTSCQIAKFSSIYLILNWRPARPTTPSK